MQSVLPVTASASCSRCTSNAAAEPSSRQGYIGRRLIAAPLRRRTHTRAVTTTAFGAAAGMDAGSVSGLSHIASAVGIALGALWVTRELALEKDQSRDTESQTECPTCNGTGFTDCFCQRWSDNDVGCSSCRGSGKMVCNSCGGSGTGRPITANLIVERQR